MPNSLLFPTGPLRGGRARRGLARLAPNRLGRVLDALALVRLRRPELANLRGHGAEQLAVGALERDRHQLLDLGGDAGRKLVHNRMRIAERQIHLLALGLRAVADAVNFEHAGEALAYAFDHVGNQLAHQAVNRAIVTGIARALHDDFRILDLGGEAGMKLDLELALGAFDLEHVAGDGRLDALVEMNR